MKAQRDEFIEYLFMQAKRDPSIIFISVDMGAQALDQWRAELPDQFIAAGISEQSAINLAAGLAAAGKKPYVYMMACWAARCFEQIRYSCAMTKLSVTILGNGVGLGYAPAGPAHEPTEDLCYMRAIEGLEIYSPSNLAQVRNIARNTHLHPALRYVRLERSVAPRIAEGPNNPHNSGIDLLKAFKGVSAIDVTFLSSGYLLDRVLDVAKNIFDELNISIQVLDVWKVKPLDLQRLQSHIEFSDLLVTIEEQARDGAFGSAILEGVSDLELLIPIKRISLSTAYAFKNGNRDQLLDTYGLSTDFIEKSVLSAIKKLSVSK